MVFFSVSVHTILPMMGIPKPMHVAKSRNQKKIFLYEEDEVQSMGHSKNAISKK
jgi:hypothetical protein